MTCAYAHMIIPLCMSATHHTICAYAHMRICAYDQIMVWYTWKLSTLQSVFCAPITSATQAHIAYAHMMICGYTWKLLYSRELFVPRPRRMRICAYAGTRGSYFTCPGSTVCGACAYAHMIILHMRIGSLSTSIEKNTSLKFVRGRA
jgi:hypothetical protein